MEITTTNEPIFWDVVGPIALLLFVLNLIWSISSFKKKKSVNLFISTCLSIGIALIFWWSIGKYMAVISILQLITALHSLKARKTLTR